MSKPAPSTAPWAIVIAGPNGAGKTTFAREFLPAEGDCPTFINADLIAEVNARSRNGRPSSSHQTPGKRAPGVVHFIAWIRKDLRPGPDRTGRPESAP